MKQLAATSSKQSNSKPAKKGHSAALSNNKKGNIQVSSRFKKASTLQFGTHLQYPQCTVAHIYCFYLPCSVALLPFHLVLPLMLRLASILQSLLLEQWRTVPTLQRDTWIRHQPGLPSAACLVATVAALVKTTRWASRIQFIAVWMQTTRTTLAPKPTASLALISGSLMMILPARDRDQGKHCWLLRFENTNALSLERQHSAAVCSCIQPASCIICIMMIHTYMHHAIIIILLLGACVLPFLLSGSSHPYCLFGDVDSLLCRSTFTASVGNLPQIRTKLLPS